MRNEIRKKKTKGKGKRQIYRYHSSYFKDISAFTIQKLKYIYTLYTNRHTHVIILSIDSVSDHG